MFANKVVIVTGGSSGIGAATAEYFAKEGAHVSIVGRNEVKLKDVAQRCEKHGAKVLVIKADVSKENEAGTIVKKTVDKFGKLDILVNNAGIVRTAKIDESNMVAVYDEVFRTNVRSIIQITNLAAPYIKQTKGNIINVSSFAAIKAPFAAMGAYAMSKAALDQFTKASAVELAPSGVRVNSVNPGTVATDIFETFSLPENSLSENDLEKMSVLGRMSDATEIADMILYMASDKARGITGSCFVVDNGVLLK